MKNRKKILIGALLGFFAPLLAFSDAVIFSGNDVLTLKQNIDLFRGAKLITGTQDPSVTSTDGPRGSLFLRFGSSGGTAYLKQDNGISTNWLQLASSSGSGVTSVGLADGTASSVFSISGSPVTTSGNISLSLTAQVKNTVLAGPTSGANAEPAFRALVGADLPNPSASTLGGVESIASQSHKWINTISTSGVPALTQPDFTDISGTVAATQLPNPSASTLGGIESYAAVTHQWINTISTSGVPSSTQPAFSDISGTVAASQLPNPSASTLGGVESYAAVTHQWINTISTSGVPSSTQPAFTDISGTCQISQGCTGQTTASAAFDALSPMTTLGDIIYGGASGTNTRLAGNTTTTRKFLRQVGNGSASAAPAWDTLVSGDIPALSYVSSIAISVPAEFSVSGSPVTSSGTITVSKANQSANLVYAGPTNGAATAPTFRSLVGADLPNPSSSTLGGVESIAAVSHNFLTAISTSGVPSQAQPAFTDISGTAAVNQGGTGQTSYTDGQLLIGNSSGNTLTKATLTAGSNVTVTNGNGSITIASSASDSGPNKRVNLGISVSSTSSAFTFSVKQSDGTTDPSGGNPVVVSMRSPTATSGAFNERSITAALSQTISSGTPLGVYSSSATGNSGNNNTWVYLYLVDSDGAGTMKLAASSLRYDDSQLQSTVKETFSTSCTQASPSVCTSTGHGLNNGDRIQLTGTISGGLTTGTSYWVVSKAANTFQLAAKPGGTAINKTTGGTQTPTVAIAGTRLASDGVYTSVPVKVIGKALFNVVPGTWAAPSIVSLTDLGNPYQPMKINFAGNAGGTSSCSAAPCTFVSKTAGVEYIDRTSAGIYTVYYSPDVAPSGLTPDCQGTAHNHTLGGQLLVQVYGNGTTSPPSNQLKNLDGSFVAADGGGSAICTTEPNF